MLKISTRIVSKAECRARMRFIKHISEFPGKNLVFETEVLNGAPLS
jgi:hypothetical protein